MDDLLVAELKTKLFGKEKDAGCQEEAAKLPEQGAEDNHERT